MPSLTNVSKGIITNISEMNALNLELRQQITIWQQSSGKSMPHQE